MSDVDIIQVARYMLDTKFPYLSDVTFSLTPVLTTGFETIAVDKQGRLYYDPDVLRQKWNNEQCMAVLFHEINHLIREHHARVGERVPKMWNIAGDLEINDDLEAVTGVKVPDILYPQQFELPNEQLAEWYYDNLPVIMQSAENPNGDGTNDFGFVDCGSVAHGQAQGYEKGDASGEGLTPQDLEVLRDKVAEKVDEETQKARGNVPKGLQRWAKKRLTKKVDWRKELAASIRQAISHKSGASDYTYARPSRRHQSSDVIMPSTYEPTPSVAVVIDTSGSMGLEEVGMAIGETGKILKSLGCRDSVAVYSVDSEVHTAQRVFSERQIKTKGGGGTDMRKGIAHALKGKPRPEVIVVVTDGYTPWPESPISAKLVIALTVPYRDETPKWAKTVVISDEET